MASRECILKSLLILQAVIDFEILARETHPELGVIPGTLDVWANDLADISDEQVTVAFAHFRRTITSDFNRKPRPGDILQFVERSQSGGWQAGWQEYLDRASSSSVLVGFSESQPWSSPLVKAAADACGGLRALAESEVSKRMYIQKAFREAYALELDREQMKQTLVASGQDLLESPDKVIQISDARTRQQQAEVDSRRDYSAEDAAADIARLKVLRHQQIGMAPPKMGREVVIESGTSLQSAASVIQAVRSGRNIQDVDSLADREANRIEQQKRVREAAAVEGFELQTFTLPEVKQA